MTEEELHLAKKDLRIVNQLIDLFFIFLTWLLVSTLIIYFGDYQNKDKVDEIPIIYLMILPLFWLYYLISEFFTQKTIGKVITKTKVVTVIGEKPTFVQILIRTLCRSIPFEYVSYLFTLSGFHDRFSGTRVIND